MPANLTPEPTKHEARKRRANVRPLVGCCEELGRTLREPPRVALAARWAALPYYESHASLYTRGFDHRSAQRQAAILPTRGNYACKIVVRILMARPGPTLVPLASTMQEPPPPLSEETLPERAAAKRSRTRNHLNWWRLLMRQVATTRPLQQ